MQIHQILPALSYGDAVSNDAIAILETLKNLGYDSNIYARHIDPKVSKYARNIDKYKDDPSNILIYHFSIASFEVTNFVKQLKCFKILIYHNITPKEYFQNYDFSLYQMCAKGLEELKDLRNYIQLGIGDSEYNRSELERVGFLNTDVLPIMVNFKKYDKILINYSNNIIKDGMINFLFVGRLSPNKRQDDVIKTFYYYHKYIDRNSKLYLVGAEQIRGYVSQLKGFVNKLGLTNDVIFAGLVNDNKLAKYYKYSDIFLSMSEHEGFCVPLLEAMYFRVPIIAYASTAIPYTLGKAGILLNKKNYIEIAELIDALLKDKILKERIIKKQQERLNDFNKEKISNKLVEIIDNSLVTLNNRI